MLFLSIQSILVALHLLTLAHAQTCYTPNGSSTTDLPCDTGSFPTFCCPEAATCLSNGLCQNSSKGILARGTCTDETWKSDACTQLCISEAEGGSTNVAQCLPDSAGNFCCANPSTSTSTACCSNENNLFHLGDLAMVSTLANVLVDPTASAAASSSTVAASTSQTSTTSSSATPSSPSATNQSSSKSTATSQGAVTVTKSQAGDSVQATQSGASPSESGASIQTTNGSQLSSSSPASSTITIVAAGNATSASTHMTTGAKAGIAVGAVFGVAIIALIGSTFLFLIRRRRQMQENEERKEELRARQAATIDAAHDGRRDENGRSNGVAEMQGLEKKPPQYATYNTANELAKQNPLVGTEEYRGVPTQQFHQTPPAAAPHEILYGSTAGVHQYSQMHGATQQHNPNSDAQSQRFQRSPPHPSHSELSGFNTPAQLNYHPQSAASELAAARMATNASPLAGSELEGGGLNHSVSVISSHGGGAELPAHGRTGYRGYELP